MKNKMVKLMLAAIVMACITGTSVYAGGNVSLDELSVGAAAVLDGGSKEAKAAVEESASEESAPKETAAAETTAETDVESIGTEKEVLIAVGAAYDTELVPEGMEDEPGDTEDDDVGGSFGYTNLGIARVEDHLNVRESADDNSKIVGKMENDSGCEILELSGNKAHIVSGSVEGYVSMDYILSGPGAVAYANQIVKKLATVSADGLKVRKAPGMEAEVVSLVAYGEELEVLEELDGWVKIRYDGEEAYVSAEFVTVDQKLKTALNMTEFLYGEGVSDVRVELCEYAKQFRGNPYVWGGTSLTKGADCSGFVLSVYAKYGIYLPHSSRAQAAMGTQVSMSEAKPGDLVFYSKGGRINHVAIYIGGGQVIHASSPKTGIRITSAYYRTPTTVRRLIQD